MLQQCTLAYVLKLALAYGCYMLIVMRSLVIMPILFKGMPCISYDESRSMLQVLTLENYDNIQFDLADDTNFGALIFILAWVVFGYYILLVLFMAIILEAFESKYDKGAMQDAYLACESFVHGVLWCAVLCWPCRYRNYPMHVTASR